MTTFPVVRRPDPGRVALVTLGLGMTGTVCGGGAAAFALENRK